MVLNVYELLLPFLGISCLSKIRIIVNLDQCEAFGLHNHEGDSMISVVFVKILKKIFFSNSFAFSFLKFIAQLSADPTQGIYLLLKNTSFLFSRSSLW
jgi:hypothetical protein